MRDDTVDCDTFSSSAANVNWPTHIRRPGLKQWEHGSTVTPYTSRICANCVFALWVGVNFVTLCRILSTLMISRKFVNISFESRDLAMLHDACIQILEVRGSKIACEHKKPTVHQWWSRSTQADTPLPAASRLHTRDK